MAPPARRPSVRADDVAAVSGKRVTRHAVHYKVDFKGGRRPPTWLKLTELAACLPKVQDYESAAECAAGAAVPTDGSRRQRQQRQRSPMPLAARQQQPEPPAGVDKGTQTLPLKQRSVSRRRSDPWHCPICFDRRADLTAAGQRVLTLQCGHLLCGRCANASVRVPEANTNVAVALGIAAEQYVRMLQLGDRRVVTCPVCRASCGMATGVHAVFI